MSEVSEVCTKCPICSTDSKDVFPTFWIRTNDVSTYKPDKIYLGCGCGLTVSELSDYRHSDAQLREILVANWNSIVESVARNFNWAVGREVKEAGQRGYERGVKEFADEVCALTEDIIQNEYPDGSRMIAARSLEPSTQQKIKELAAKRGATGPMPSVKSQPMPFEVKLASCVCNHFRADHNGENCELKCAVENCECTAFMEAY